jgi:hypothetical protein
MSSGNLFDWSLPISQVSTECEDLTERMPAKETESGKANRSLNWCFTLNNPWLNCIQQEQNTSDTSERILNIFRLQELPFLTPSSCLYPIKTCVWQLERGSSGTLHLQGYLEMHSSQRFSTMQDIFNGKAHLEKRKKTRLRAIAYCAKDDDGLTTEDREKYNDTGPWFYTTKDETLSDLLEKAKTANASRSDRKFAKFVESVKAGDDDLALTDKYGPLFSRNLIFVDRLRIRLTAPRAWKTKVYVIQGPTGCGKSKMAYDEFGPNIYTKPCGEWWDCYDRHETVLLDEFYGGIKWSIFLQLLDRYQLLVPIKSAFRQFVAKTIIITTNGIPCKWYKFNYAQVARRITEYRVWNEDTKQFDVFDNSDSTSESDSMRVYLSAYNKMKDYHNKN